MTYAAMAEDVVAWMNAQGLAQATVMGHSMGGKTAMVLACRDPERVTRLIIVDIAPKDYFWAAHRAEFAAMNELELVNLQSRAEAELRFEARVADWAMRKFIATNLERVADGGAGWRWVMNLPVVTAALPVLEKNPLGAGERFDGEVLFIVGGKSRYVQSADHAAITAHFTRAQVETITESGHNPHMETRGAFVRLIRTAQ